MIYPKGYPTPETIAAFSSGIHEGAANHVCSKELLTRNWTRAESREAFGIGFDMGQMQPAEPGTARWHEEQFFKPGVTPIFPGEVILG